MKLKTIQSLQKRQEKNEAKIISNKFEKQKWKIELEGSNWKKIKNLQNDQEQFKKSKEWRLILNYFQLRELSWNFKCQTWISREKKENRRKKRIRLW